MDTPGWARLSTPPVRECHPLRCLPVRKAEMRVEP
jgi:hypothetical protein